MTDKERAKAVKDVLKRLKDGSELGKTMQIYPVGREFVKLAGLKVEKFETSLEEAGVFLDIWYAAGTENSKLLELEAAAKAGNSQFLHSIPQGKLDEFQKTVLKDWVNLFFSNTGAEQKQKQWKQQ